MLRRCYFERSEARVVSLTGPGTQSHPKCLACEKSWGTRSIVIAAGLALAAGTGIVVCGAERVLQAMLALRSHRASAFIEPPSGMAGTSYLQEHNVFHLHWWHTRTPSYASKDTTVHGKPSRESKPTAGDRL